MPLSEKVRVEVYLPDLPKENYQYLVQTLDREFTFTCGGCTILRGLEGSYLSKMGMHVRERIILLYTDTPLLLKEDHSVLDAFVAEVRDAVYEALDEESILVAAHPVYHGA